MTGAGIRTLQQCRLQGDYDSFFYPEDWWTFLLIPDDLPVEFKFHGRYFTLSKNNIEITDCGTAPYLLHDRRDNLLPLKLLDFRYEIVGDRFQRINTSFIDKNLVALAQQFVRGTSRERLESEWNERCCALAYECDDCKATSYEYYQFDGAVVVDRAYRTILSQQLEMF